MPNEQSQKLTYGVMPRPDVDLQAKQPEPVVRETSGRLAPRSERICDTDLLANVNFG